MASLQRRILENILATVLPVDGVRAVSIGRPPPDLHMFVRPHVAVLPQSAIREDLTEELQEVTFTVIVRVYVDETHQEAGLELEDILEPVDRALCVDRTRGGLAETTRIIETRWPGIDAEEPHAGADLWLTIHFNRQRKDPANS